MHTSEIQADKSAPAGAREAFVPNALQLLRWLYFGRVMLAFVMFIAAAVSFKAIPPEWLLILAVAAIASVVMSGWSAWYTHIRQAEPTQTFLYGQALFDLGLVTTVVHVTEGPASQFPALYIIVIAISAVLMPLGASLLVTALASLLYLADIIWWQPVLLTAAVWLQIAVFVAVFLVTGLIASRVQVIGAEREVLQREVHRLRLEASDILGNLRSGVVTVDGSGKLVYANAAACDLLDMGLSDVLERPVDEVLGARAPALRDVIVDTQRRRVKGRRADALVHTAARTFPIGFTTTSLDLDKDDPPSVAAIFTDISDLKRLEELRLRTERLEAVAELSASLAHEIKNPLASIRSSVEQLSKSSRANEDERFLAELVLRESDRLSGLLTQFLDFSRVRVTICRPVDLAKVVAGAVQVVRQHPDCTDDVRIELTAKPIRVEGDEDLLHRIVVNLILNAIQASASQASIELEVRQARADELPPEFDDGDAAVLRVSDNGPGIPPDLRDRLFEPFVTGRVGGSGLGLAIVQRAVQAHRGAVFADSTPGRCTTFTVFIPAKAQAEVAA